MADITVTQGDSAHDSEFTATYQSGSNTITLRSYSRSSFESAATRKARILADVASTLDTYP